MFSGASGIRFEDSELSESYAIPLEKTAFPAVHLALRRFSRFSGDVHFKCDFLRQQGSQVNSLPEFLDFILCGMTISINSLDLFWPTHSGSEYCAIPFLWVSEGHI